MAGVLSLSELNGVNPEKVYQLQEVLNPNLWDSINLASPLPSPIRLKFDENIRTNLDPNLKNKKGIYMFVVEPNHKFPVPEIKHLVYIGRVMSDNTFFKRFYEYVNTIGETNAKRNRQLMTNCWPNKTFVYFFKLTNDADIKQIEQELNDKIIPVLNNKFFLEEAKNSRSIYN